MWFQDSKDELSDQIRFGVTLKKVKLDNNYEMNFSTRLPSRYAGMLQRALREWTIAVCLSSSNEENEGSDDDEWDDWDNSDF